MQESPQKIAMSAQKRKELAVSEDKGDDESGNQNTNAKKNESGDDVA